MSNVNTTPAAPEFEYVVGSFEPTEHFYTMVCKKPSPRGPWVFVTKHLQGSTFVPEVNKTYVVAIMGPTQSGRARRGQISLGLETVRMVLIEALKKAEWMLDRLGQHQIVGECLATPFGRFKPFYDNGYRLNGQDEGPIIGFAPIDSLIFGAEVLQDSLCRQEFFCLDKIEIERAKTAKRPEGVRAAPGELLAAKMAGQNGD